MNDYDRERALMDYQLLRDYYQFVHDHGSFYDESKKERAWCSKQIGLVVRSIIGKTGKKNERTKRN